MTDSHAHGYHIHTRFDEWENEWANWQPVGYTHDGAMFWAGPTRKTFQDPHKNAALVRLKQDVLGHTFQRATEHGVPEPVPFAKGVGKAQVPENEFNRRERGRERFTQLYGGATVLEPWIAWDLGSPSPKYQIPPNGAFDMANIDMTSIDDVKRGLDILVKRAGELERIYALEPSDDDSVISWNHKFSDDEDAEEFTYVALRKNGRWYHTGQTGGNRHYTWEQLTQRFPSLAAGEFWLVSAWDYQG